MTITIGAFSSPGLLTAQPLDYDESKTYAGKAARSWTISGLLTEAEWVSLNDVYQAWRDVRILDADSVESGVVGTTINFSGTGFGQTWTNVPCWFLEAPSARQMGNWVDAKVRLVDAAEKLEVLLREKEEEEDEDLPDLGTIDIGGAIIKYTRPPETLAAMPTVEATSTGVDYIAGPLGAREVLDIEGTTNAAGWPLIQTWVKNTVASVPPSGSWFPITAPTATAKNKIVDGVKIVEYSVSLSLAKLR